MSYTIFKVSCIIGTGDKMKDFISIVIYGTIIFVLFTFFIQLLPVLLPILIVVIIVNMVRRKNAADHYQQHNQQTYYEQPRYEQDSTSQYSTSGSIKKDVIDVEYKETVEK